MMPEKQYLPLDHYAFIIECLEENYNVEECLRALCQYDMDLSLAETWIITGLVTCLMTDETYGVIAEWLVRQWSIACGEEDPIQPRKIHVPRDWRREGSRVLFRRKAKNYGYILRKRMIQKKIRKNRSFYNKEKELEQLKEVQEAVKEEPSPFKVPTLYNAALLKREHKNKSWWKLPYFNV